MKAKLLHLLLFIFPIAVFAQLPDGAQAPDFTLDDINGGQHNLYDYLDQGYSVVLDFSATWCPPCWSYHQSGILEDVWDEFGPPGDDNVMVFMVEADPNTNQQCIYGPSGCNNTSLGDWTAGVNYPILNPPSGEAADTRDNYSIAYWPTLYGISPNGDIREIGQAGVGEWESWVNETFQMWNTTWTVEDGGCETSSIDLEPVGGSGDIEFLWSNGATTEDISDIESGDYYVTLTDDNSSYEVVLGPIEVDNSNVYDVELADYENIFCNGEETGFIEIDIEGGSGDFEYVWSNGADTEDLYDIPAGAYDVTIIDTDSGCEQEHSYFIEEPDEIEPFWEQTDAECGMENGIIEFDVDGGEYPYTYYFEDFETTEEEVIVAPGEYNVTIVDSYGCEAYMPTIIIDQTNGPEADTEVLGAFNCNATPVYVNADSSAVGNNIIYYWYDPSYTLIDTGYQVQVDSVGLYTLEVYDMLEDCTTSEAVMVNEDFTTPMAVAQANSQLDCNNPTALISGQGSTADGSVTYMWTTSDGQIMTDPTAIDITAGAAGTYELQVTNIMSGCTMTASTVISSTGLPTVELTGADAFCDGGNTTLCVTPESNESVEWYIDGAFVSSNDCLEVSNTADVTVQLIDNNTGCSADATMSVEALAAPSVAINGDFEICSSETGSLCVNANADESISWMINGTPVSSGTCVEFNSSSMITATITNNLTGCSETQTLNTIVNEQPNINIDTPMMLDCNNTSTALNLNTNVAGTVTWTDAGGNVLSNQEDITVNSAGTYFATVTTAAGCETTTSVDVQADLNDFATAAYSSMAEGYAFDFTDESVGEVNTYLWDFGDGNTSTEQSPSHTYAEAGYYNVCLSVTNDCGTTTECNEVLAYTEMRISAVISNVTCFGDSDGQASITVVGGLEGYEYSWDNAQQGSVISDLGPGVYTITVRDATGAEIVQEITITEPSPIEVNGVVEGTTAGSADGTITLDINGGNGNYSVSWDNGATGMMLTGLERGDYTATITDELGCSTTETYSVLGTTNVDEISFINNFTIMPNPASEYVDVQLVNQSDNQLRISMVNMAGQEMHSQLVRGTNITERITLDDYTAGVYMIKVEANNKVSVRKLIITK